MDYLRKLRKCVLNAHKYTRKHLSVAVRRQWCQYHKERKDFHAGTKVWLFTPTVRKGSSAKLTCYWSGPWIVCAEPTSSETLLCIAPDPSWAKQLRNSGTQVVSIDRLKLYNNTKAVRVLECKDALDMDDDEFAENITLPAKNEPQVATAGTGTSRAGGGGGGTGGATDDPDTGKDKPPTPAGLAPGPW